MHNYHSVKESILAMYRLRFNTDPIDDHPPAHIIVLNKPLYPWGTVRCVSVTGECLVVHTVFLTRDVAVAAGWKDGAFQSGTIRHIPWHHLYAFRDHCPLQMTDLSTLSPALLSYAMAMQAVALGRKTLSRSDFNTLRKKYRTHKPIP